MYYEHKLSSRAFKVLAKSTLPAKSICDMNPTSATKKGAIPLRTANETAESRSITEVERRCKTCAIYDVQYL